MTRECHVRFCESAGVRSPRATHLVVAAATREALESYVLPKIKTFLAERGLSLNPDKTKIVNLNEGFDFLGFNVSFRRSSRKTRHSSRITSACALVPLTITTR